MTVTLSSLVSACQREPRWDQSDFGLRYFARVALIRPSIRAISPLIDLEAAKKPGK